MSQSGGARWWREEILSDQKSQKVLKKVNSLRKVLKNKVKYYKKKSTQKCKKSLKKVKVTQKSIQKS